MRRLTFIYAILIMSYGCNKNKNNWTKIDINQDRRAFIAAGDFLGKKYLFVNLFVYESNKVTDICFKADSGFTSLKDTLSVFVAFDNGKEKIIKVIPWELDERNKLYKNISIINTDEFVSELKLSKNLILKAELFNSGYESAEFNITGLKQILKP